METHELHYETITRLTTAISQCKDPEEVAMISAESVKSAFNAKGCCVFIVNRKTGELGLVGSSGLSQEYLEKGPTHFKQAIKEAKDAVPIAIYDVMSDKLKDYDNISDFENDLADINIYEHIDALEDPILFSLMITHLLKVIISMGCTGHQKAA